MHPVDAKKLEDLAKELGQHHPSVWMNLHQESEDDEFGYRDVEVGIGDEGPFYENQVALFYEHNGMPAGLHAEAFLFFLKNIHAINYAVKEHNKRQPTGEAERKRRIDQAVAMSANAVRACIEHNF